MRSLLVAIPLLLLSANTNASGGLSHELILGAWYVLIGGLTLFYLVFSMISVAIKKYNKRETNIFRSTLDLILSGSIIGILLPAYSYISCVSNSVNRECAQSVLGNDVVGEIILLNILVIGISAFVYFLVIRNSKASNV